MDAFSQLLVLAQIAATLLGFMAIFMVVADRQAKFCEADRHFLQAMVLSGAVVILMSILPGTLVLHLPATQVWIVSLVCALVVGVVSALYQGRVQLRMTKKEAAKIHLSWHVIAWGMAAVSGGLMISGLVLEVDQAGMFVAAITMLLVLCLWSFLSLVFRKFF